ncbi:unnamed protein product [Rodentolepis nana]|uniref:Uncharacterized protein n=1 Tax=Rodentolepis nana TaxID=102285 RepID=A0A3P7S3C2_RODNA|nr:unnamed protein product [Rodentolepis nana]
MKNPRSMLLERLRSAIRVDIVRSKPPPPDPTLILRRDRLPRKKNLENPEDEEAEGEREEVREIGGGCNPPLTALKVRALFEEALEGSLTRKKVWQVTAYCQKTLARLAVSK